MKSLLGVGASAGVEIGPVVLLRDETFVVPDQTDPLTALNETCAAVALELQLLSEEAASLDRVDASEVLRAQSLMAQDPMIIDAVEPKLDAGETFDASLLSASDELQQMLASLPDPYLAARAADVGEVFDRVRRTLAGLPSGAGVQITEPSVLCAETLTAAQTALLDPKMVLGLATVDGGPTSHVAIIARAMGVAAVVGLADLMTSIEEGASVALDGTTGEFVVNPDSEAVGDFEGRRVAAAAAAEAASKFKGQAIEVAGRPIKIAANVANDADLERAVAEQADGIGLFRTEFLYLDQPNPPSEDAQVEVYVKALESFDFPVVVRTFDIGGDKPASFLDLPQEENPFLGVRGVRLYQQQPELFRTQVRALLRAAPAGDLWVMIPMVATNAEVEWVRAQFDEAHTDLANEGQTTGDLKLGAMVEVPSAALMADFFADQLDFLSIGTNDLTQYTLAADRTNGSVDHLSDPLHPAVLELCRITAQAGLKHDVSVSVCGLAAADPIAAALFAQMGIEKLSVAGPSVNLSKASLSALDSETLKELAVAVSTASDGPQVRELAGQFFAGR